MSADKVMTVLGPIEPGEMGLTLHHEHVMSTFGAEAARYPFYDVEAVERVVLPYLGYLRGLGVGTIVDCTAAYFGRHPELLRRFSRESGLHIVTNTGYYAAADDRYVPAHAFEESAEQIAARWIREARESIDETGIYPGLIKTAVDGGAFSVIDRKLIEAAAITHRESGLTIQTHTGDNLEAAREILQILAGQGVDASAWIWIHAHNLVEASPAVSAAEAGAWISLDGLNPASAAHILDLLNALRAQGLLDHVLLSHDGDTYCGGSTRPYHYLLTDFLPLLSASGYSEEEITLLTRANPARAYRIAPRVGSSL